MTTTTAVVNLLLSGKAPAEIAPNLAGARLFAINKKADNKGRQDIRPIASGELIRRLVSKVCCQSAKETAAEILLPDQYGVGVKGGAEAVIHMVRALLNTHKGWGALKLDFRNAFNELDRQPMLRNIAQFVPNLLAWATWCYGNATTLFYGNHRTRWARFSSASHSNTSARHYRLT